MSSRKPPKNRVVKINPLDGQARWVLSRFTPGKARGWDSSARSFPTSAFWREKASLPPFQRSLRSLPPLLGLRPATKRAFPLGTPLLCLRKSPNSLRPTFPETPTVFPLDCSRGPGGINSYYGKCLGVSGRVVPAQSSTGFLAQHPRLFPQGGPPNRATHRVLAVC